jgi:diguanylate cyclase (GGDEF)-like protein/PAS domain S-box-containing protein
MVIMNKRARSSPQKTRSRPNRPHDGALEAERTRAILASVSEAIITTDAEGRITRFNQVAQKLTGFTRTQAEGAFFSEVITVIDEASGAPIENPLKQILRRKESIRFEKHAAMISPSGRRFAIEAVAAPMFSPKRSIAGIVFVFRETGAGADSSGKRPMRENRDELTGLFNRNKFKERLEELTADAAGHDRRHALLYLDLDKFKIINDTCGHVAGDQLLKRVGAVIKGKVRQTDLVARLGGDEFGILLVHCPLPKANEIAGTICEAVRRFHFAWKDSPFTVGVSIGVVAIMPSSDNPETILSAADGSCYLAKEKGGNRVHLHSEDDRELSQRHGEMQYISRITNAFEHDLFRLFYQPIVALGKNKEKKRIWYEILIRMMEDGGRVVGPMNFLPAAERYDMMPAIDRWVFTAFFKFYKKNLEGRLPPEGFLCDINVSGMTLNDDSFLTFIRDLFAAYNVAPQTICIEITETAAIANLDQALRFITELKALGCKFSLDDFGSGLSSFKYLKHLPVDYLKIDGSFVKNIVENTVDAAIVETINDIGHLMGIMTVAEFVENRAIVEKLEKIGVDFAQGYCIARPRPLDESLRDVPNPSYTAAE